MSYSIGSNQRGTAVPWQGSLVLHLFLFSRFPSTTRAPSTTAHVEEQQLSSPVFHLIYNYI